MLAAVELKAPAIAVRSEPEDEELTEEQMLTELAACVELLRMPAACKVLAQSQPRPASNGESR